MRVDHALRLAGGARGEHHFGDGVRLDCGKSALDGAVILHGLQCFERLGSVARGSVTAHDECAVQVSHRRQRGREERAFADVQQARAERTDDALQLAEVFRHQRVSRRNGRNRHAHVQAGQREHCVLHAVVRQDRDGALRGQLSLEQPGSHAPHLVEHFAVAEATPARFSALQQERALRRPARPDFEELAAAAFVRVERVARAQQRIVLTSQHSDRGRREYVYGGSSNWVHDVGSILMRLRTTSVASTRLPRCSRPVPLPGAR